MTGRLPTPDEVRGLWDHMAARYRTRARTKGDEAAWEAVARLLDQIGIVEGDAFMRDFATTIGVDIFVPFEVGVASDGWTLWDQLCVCVHEHQHVAQYLADPGSYLVEYVTRPDRRAHLEADAYATQLELDWLAGRTPRAKDIDAIGAHLASYALSQDDIAAARRELVTVARSLTRAGAVTREATREAARWLDEHAPGVLTRRA